MIIIHRKPLKRLPHRSELGTAMLTENLGKPFYMFSEVANQRAADLPLRKSIALI